MREKELQVFKKLTERGLSKDYLRQTVGLPRLRAQLRSEDGDIEDVVADVALDLATEGAAGAAADVAGAILEPIIEQIFPPPPPLPVGFETGISLRNCNLRLIGQVGEGAYMKIEVSDNGDTWFFDDPGTVEIITDPPLPNPPGGDSSSNVIDGDGSISITGPRTVWVHLKGEEDACSIDVTIFPAPAPASGS